MGSVYCGGDKNIGSTLFKFRFYRGGEEKSAFGWLARNSSSAYKKLSSFGPSLFNCPGSSISSSSFAKD